MLRFNSNTPIINYMAMTRRKMRYGYYRSYKIFKEGDLEKATIWHSYVNCTTPARRMKMHEYWQDRILSEENLGERIAELLQFSADRAFSKMTRSMWWKLAKRGEACHCYHCDLGKSHQGQARDFWDQSTGHHLAPSSGTR